jgi:hypothetical protein
MQEIDMIIGKEVLKQLPGKMDAFTANSKDDNVTSNVGFIGTTIHRSYGPANDVDLSINGNSPLITTINAFLNTPLLGGMMSNGNNKVIKVQFSFLGCFLRKMIFKYLDLLDFYHYFCCEPQSPVDKLLLTFIV